MTRRAAFAIAVALVLVAGAASVETNVGKIPAFVTFVDEKIQRYTPTSIPFVAMNVDKHTAMSYAQATNLLLAAPTGIASFVGTGEPGGGRGPSPSSEGPTASPPRTPPFDPASYEPDLRTVAQLAGRPLTSVREEFESVRSRADTRKRAKAERRNQGNGPGVPIPSVDEFAARIAIAEMKSPLMIALGSATERASFERSFGRLRDSFVSSRSRPLPEPRTVDMEAGRFIDWKPKGVELVIQGKDGDHKIPVLDGLFLPLRTLLVEGDAEPYREVDMGGDEPVCGRADEILARLERGGRVLSHRYFRDVVAHLFREFGGAPVRTHATYGIFTWSDGILEECADPTPVRSEQIEAHAEVAPAIHYRPHPGELAAYFELDRVGRFAAHEVVPIRGVAALAPFTPVLRSARRMVPNVFSHAKETGLGKTLVSVVYSERLFGRRATSADAVRSAYRFPATADACCVPQAFSEASDLDPSLFEAAFKVMVENWPLTKRGKSTLEMLAYLSRSVFFFSANAFPLRARPHLVRLIVIAHDAAALAERVYHKAEVDRLVAGLAPIGPFVARCLLERFPTEGALLGELDRLEAEVLRTAELFGWSFVDLRRAQVWAAVLLGNEAWEIAAAKLGVATVPSLSRREFFEQVIRRCEEGTFEAEVTPLAAFRSFRARWKAMNTVRATTEDGRPFDQVRGRGALWEDGWLEVPRKPEGASLRLSGEYVTQAVVDEYRQSQPLADLRFASLAELARAALRDAGLQPREIEEVAFERDKSNRHRPCRHTFQSGNRDRAAFVPHELAEEMDRPVVLERKVVRESSPADEEWLSGPWSESGPKVVLDGPASSPRGPPGPPRTTGGPQDFTSENWPKGPPDHQIGPSRTGAAE